MRIGNLCSRSTTMSRMSRCRINSHGGTCTSHIIVVTLRTPWTQAWRYMPLAVPKRQNNHWPCLIMGSTILYFRTIPIRQTSRSRRYSGYICVQHPQSRRMACRLSYSSCLTIVQLPNLIVKCVQLVNKFSKGWHRTVNHVLTHEPIVFLPSFGNFLIGDDAQRIWIKFGSTDIFRGSIEVKLS